MKAMPQAAAIAAGHVDQLGQRASFRIGSVFNLLVGVHREKEHRCPPRGGQADDQVPAPGEMFGIGILAWVEERDYSIRLGIDAGEVWPLPAIAMPASQG
jgi:hypothetical protein